MRRSFLKMHCRCWDRGKSVPVSSGPSIFDMSTSMSGTHAYFTDMLAYWFNRQLGSSESSLQLAPVLRQPDDLNVDQAWIPPLHCGSTPIAARMFLLFALQCFCLACVGRAQKREEFVLCGHRPASITSNVSNAWHCDLPRYNVKLEKIQVHA